jgi:hypothetical protein
MRGNLRAVFGTLPRHGRRARVERSTKTIMRDCAEICAVAASFVARQSDHVDARVHRVRR